MGYTYEEDKLLREDKECALALVRNCPAEFPVLQDTFCNDKDVVLAAVRGNQWNLSWASRALQDDIDVVLAAVLHPSHGKTNENSVLQHASDELKDMPELVLIDKHANSVLLDSHVELVLLDIGLVFYLAGCPVRVSKPCIQNCCARIPDLPMSITFLVTRLWLLMLFWWPWLVWIHAGHGHTETKTIIFGYVLLGVPLYIVFTHRFANWIWKHAKLREK